MLDPTFRCCKVIVIVRLARARLEPRGMIRRWARTTRHSRSSTPPDPEIHGKIEVAFHDSEADFPEPLKPPVGAPNVLLIMGDDVGYGHTSTFGDRRTRRHSTDFPSVD